MATTKVVVGRLGRPHGVRGEVTVELRTDEPELRFAPGSSLFVEGSSRKPLLVESYRFHGSIMLVSFRGVTDRNQAEALRGTILESEVDDQERPTGEDEFYDRQLVGLQVKVDQQSIGHVTEVLHLPAHDVLVIVGENKRELLLPFIAEFVSEVNLEARSISATPPPGLFDENFEVVSDTNAD